MSELKLSGDARYDRGKEYTEFLLDEIFEKRDPATVLGQVQCLESLGTISKEAAEALRLLLQASEINA